MSCAGAGTGEAARVEPERADELDRLLAALAGRREVLVSRGELVEHLYDQDFDRDSNTIEVFVGRLRKKLGVNVIHTVRGLGYKLDEGAAGDDADAAH